MYMNKVELVGFAGMDPEVKVVGKASKLASFSLATSESYKRNEEWVKTTHWHKLIGWNKFADQIHDLVKKGKKLSVVGKLTYRTYEDKNGVRRRDTEIIITELTEAVK